MNKKLKLFILLACTGLVLLIFFVHFYPHSSLDIYISKELREEVDEPRAIEFASPLTWISVLGNGFAAPISILVAAFLFLIAHYYEEAFYVLLVIVADFFVLVLKWIIRRPRPTEDIIKVLHKFQQSSFPSGHVVHYVVFFGFLLIFLIHRRKFILPIRVLLSLVLIILILTIPISRVYLGAHWATDVLGGYLVGFIFLSVILSFYLQE